MSFLENYEMEIENENSFSPDLDDLYGDNVDDFMQMFAVDNIILAGDHVVGLNYRSQLNRHIEQAMKKDKFRLPSFGEGFEWLNTSSPISSDDLSNKIYVLDFFTYCCINCLHVLPHLKRVEEEFANNPGVSVIGIHSPKFTNEKNLVRVKEAVIKNGIKHPVLNDSECKLWKAYGVNCWPTVFIVGPAHTLLFVLVGETQIDKLHFLCQQVVNYFTSNKIKLDMQPLPILLIEEDSSKKDMLFPGHVSASGNRIIVSDTGHNRLLLMSSSLQLQEVIGSGCRGSNDGPFNLASFNSPNGTAWYRDSLYVADTGNHSIRKVCFNRKIVTTVFSRAFYEQIPSLISSETSTEFLSPWDVCLGPELDSDLTALNVLYVAVAGAHQIWSLNLKECNPDNDQGIINPFAGSGKEENKPNVYRFKAGFAQPSGITYSSLAPGYLFVADSESSTVKSIALDGGAVRVIVGGDQDPSNLFQFGDQDDKYMKAKLQHPMGVCVIKKDRLAITDTFNHKIKIVNFEERDCFTYDVNEEFCEPSGICCSDDMLLVADTNNHRIVPIQISEGKIVKVPKHFDESISITNCSAEYVPTTTILLGCEGKIFGHFQVNANSKYEYTTQWIEASTVSLKGDLKLCKVHARNAFFGDGQPSLILRCPGEKEISSEGLSCEVSLINVMQVCDKIKGTCCIKQIYFKFIVKCSRLSSLKSVYLDLNAVFD